ncbi:MAG: RidA family protein [Dysgonamonadaceae bacterium]|jgi:2-iminobutanoate/2-iminopropanoate deaminase|nr:RidA family protein [Dysgonamonadaceae bacterium]
MKQVISTSNAPAAIGPYSQAVKAGNFVFLSGQLGINPQTGEFVPGSVTCQTVQVFNNIKAVLAEAGLTLDNVVKTTVFLADIADFAAMNEIYAQHFKEPYPARSAFAVKTLPKNALVEIEIIAAIN